MDRQFRLNSFCSLEIDKLKQLKFMNSLSAQASPSQVPNIFSNYIQSLNLSILLEEKPPNYEVLSPNPTFPAIRGVNRSYWKAETNNRATGGRNSNLEFGLLQDRRVTRGPHVHHHCNLVARSIEVSTRKRTRWGKGQQLTRVAEVCADLSDPPRRPSGSLRRQQGYHEPVVSSAADLWSLESRETGKFT